jgi:hypothetical protein
VPPYAGRFGGDFMRTSRGDQEQIFVGPHYLGKLNPAYRPHLHLLLSGPDVEPQGMLFGP